MNSWFLPCFKVVLFFFFFTSLYKTYASSSSSSSTVSYSDHCASIVPESTPTSRHHDTSVVPFTGGYYTGGDRLLPKKPSNTSFYGVGSYVRFRRSRNIYKTDTHGVYKLQAHLYFRLPYRYYGNASNSRYGSNYRRPARGRMGFSLTGFWSEVSRKLCMVGSARWQNEEGKSLDIDGVLKLKIAGDNSSILTSLVSGSLETIYPPADSRYFEPVFIYEFPYVSNYHYSLGTGNEGCFGDFGVAKTQSVRLDSSSFCSSTFSSDILSFILKYPSQCKTSHDCDFLGGRRGYFPMFMRLRAIQCSTDEEEMRIRYVVSFGDTSYVDYYGQFDSNSTLIAEGSWHEKENSLCIAACRISNPANHWEKEVADCTTRLSLRYPSVWSIRDNSDVVGHIWTHKTIDGSRSSRKVEFHSWDNSIMVPGLKYNYTKLDRVRKSWPVKKAAKRDGTQYPSGHSYDMRFDMSVKHSKMQFAWGSARPLFVGNEMYGQSSVVISDSIGVSETEAGFGTIEETNGSVNMSYKLSFSPFSLEQGSWFSSLNHSMDDRGQVEITAEGVYDAETGHLCMIGCRKLSSHTRESSNTSFDCEILVNFKFPPTTRTERGELIKGSIKSTRNKSDRLYFEDLSVTSYAFYASEAEWSIWRMDLEIMMALISNTFTCIFIGLQLFHVRKNPQVLSYISLVMVLLLSIGHMIPLVLNFEAIFLGNHDKQMLFLSTGRWLEANEVTVRIVTMVAFLLEIRIFQLVWSARSTHENKKSVWAGEKKAALVSLLMCVIGGLLMLLVNWMRTRYGYEISLPPSLWGDLRSYAGLILDGFLLPQILLNVFCSSRESLLSRSFYVGMTVVRALPHGYDLYRGHTSMRYVSEGQTGLQYINGTSYYYANPSADFYSTTWDVIIPCVGILLAVIIFLQQRLGGRWILPQRFREVELYQKVPVVDNQ